MPNDVIADHSTNAASGIQSIGIEKLWVLLRALSTDTIPSFGRTSERPDPSVLHLCLHEWPLNNPYSISLNQANRSNPFSHKGVLNSTNVNEWKVKLWMALFLWVRVFVDWTKMTHSWGSKFVVIIFSFIIHTENFHFVCTGIRVSDPPRKPQKLVPTKF